MAHACEPPCTQPTVQAALQAAMHCDGKLAPGGEVACTPEGEGACMLEDEEAQEEDEEAHMDSYLRPAHIRNVVKHNTVFLAVPALPRG